MSLATVQAKLKEQGKPFRGDMYCCPAHDDRTPSLHVTQGDKSVVFKCFAGCTQEQVLESMKALGVPVSELFDEPRAPVLPRRDTYYEFRDEQGNPLYREVRRWVRPGEKKQLYMQIPKSGDGWRGYEGCMKNVRRVLYRLPEVLEAVAAGDTIFLCEGPKDAEALRSAKQVATAQANGASSKWPYEFTEALRGAAEVVVVADKDEDGRKRAAHVAKELEGAVERVSIVEAARGKDAFDHLEAGLGVDEFVDVTQEVLGTSPPNGQHGAVDSSSTRPNGEYRAGAAQSDESEPESGASSTPRVPERDNAEAVNRCFPRGTIIRELIDLTQPHSEADPLAVGAIALTFAGAFLGRCFRFWIGNAVHGPNVFLLVVGESGTSKKGTAGTDARAVVRAADPDFADSRMHGGIQSAEGLLDLLNPNAENPDQRFVFEEEEFARVLRSAERTGNIVSETMRAAWDSRPLHLKTKKEHLIVPEPHVAMVCHTTPTDLDHHLRDADKSNGMLNRFIILTADRSKLLANPGRPDEQAMNELGQRLRGVAMEARQHSYVIMTPEAQQLYEQRYLRDAERPVDCYTPLLQRLMPNAIRLSSIHAALDERRNTAIGLEHLEPALALVEYAEASVRSIWKSVTGNACADRILSCLDPGEEKSKWNLRREVYGGHRVAPEFEPGLLHLKATRWVAELVGEAGPSGGRRPRMIRRLR